MADVSRHAAPRQATNSCPRLTCVKAGTHRAVVRSHAFLPTGGDPMFDTETTALLRAVLEEVCENVSRSETGARVHVASKILEAATNGERSVDDLRRVGQKALASAPSLWR